MAQKTKKCERKNVSANAKRSRIGVGDEVFQLSTIKEGIMTQGTLVTSNGCFGSLVRICLVMVGLMTSQAAAQDKPSTGADPAARKASTGSKAVGGFGTLLSPHASTADPQRVREQLTKSLQSAMRKLVDAEKKPLSDQRSLLIDSAVDWDEASVAADRASEAEANSAADLQKQRDVLRDANQPTMQSLEEFNQTLGEVQQQLETVKQSADRARRDAVESPESLMKRAAAKQWFVQQRQIETMVANLESLHSAVTQPAIAAQTHLMLLDGLIQIHTVQANSLRIASMTFRSTAKAQRVMADVLKIEAAHGNSSLLTVGDLPQVSVSGPTLAPAEEREFAAWLRSESKPNPKNETARN